ncbi:hypothetical protein [Geoglobus ahangari]|uniref:hypothetical protein n=1 Tax=Geoglobus ahangari TaxID=113653 RepID=UPI00064E4AAD|nr:hypothetical protein [Geoglobus ahangari]
MSHNLVEIEEDLQYIAVASKRSDFDHALIRLVLSTLADEEEILNLTRRDLAISGGTFSVYLRRAGRSRKAPIDERTYLSLKKISEGLSGRERIFKLSRSEIDDIIARHSPEGRIYNLTGLRKAVKRILEDNLLGRSFDELDDMGFEELCDFMGEFHPMFSGMWDLDDDDVAYEYFMMLSERHGISEVSEMSELSGESEERIERLMGRKWYLNYLDLPSE